MAKDIEINSVEYNGAKKVDIPLTDGSGKAHFYETSQDSVQADHVLVGETFHGSEGEETGTMPNIGAQEEYINDAADVIQLSKGYHDGTGKVSIAPAERGKVLPQNIMLGTRLLGVDGTGDISDLVSDWLDDHIINPASPPVDSSLSVSGAAADAEVVGKLCMLSRGVLPENTNLDGVTKFGLYLCNDSNLSTYTNYPDGAESGRLLVLMPSEATTADRCAQMLFSKDGRVFFRVANMNSVFGSWRTIAGLDDLAAMEEECLITRGTLPADTDLDTVANIGLYLCNVGNLSTYVHYPEGAASGRLLVLKPKPTADRAAQILMANDQRIYFRVADTSGVYPTTWKMVQNEQKASMKLRMANSSFLNSTGLWSTGYDNFQYFVSTGTFVDLHGAHRIDVEWGKTNSDKQVSALKMWSFDENFEMVGALQYLWPEDQTAVGRVVNRVDIPDGVRYVKLSVMATDGNLDRDMTITAYGTNLLTMAKEVKADPNLTSGFRAFGFTVEDSVYTTGRIMLPPNYTPNGAPVPVIIYAHGDMAYMSKNGEMYSVSEGDYSAQWHFLRDCGYALIDCWPWTSRYDGVSAGDQTVGSNASGAWVMPTSCKAYLRLIETVTQYYNVDANNIFVLCKSFGGHMAQWLCSTGKVKAGAFLAPGLALLHGGTGSGPYDFGRSACVRTVMAQDLGFEDADGATVDEFIEGLTTDAQKLAFYTKNEKKLCGYWDEFINTVGMTYAEKLDAVLANQRPLNNLTRIGYPPVKLWYAADDTSILRPQVEAMAQQIRNGGGYAETVVIPAGHGGHHAVDNSPTAPQQTNVTTPLGIHYDSVSQAYYQAFKFFEQHRV